MFISCFFPRFQDSRIDTYQRLFAHMKENPDDMQTSYDEGIKRVLLGNYAFFMENTMIDYQVQRNCELMPVGGLLDSKGYGIGTPMSKCRVVLYYLDLMAVGGFRDWSEECYCLSRCVCQNST